jgi:potassium/chloride transporter 4/5/6
VGSWHTALAGVLWCVILMWVISWYITIIVMVCGTALAAYIIQSSAFTEWGDAVSGMMFNQIRDMLLYLTRSDSSHHARNWRPQILIITRLRPRSLHDNSREYDVKVEHENLIRFAGQLKKGKGLTVVSALIQGDPTSVDRDGVKKSEAMIQQFLAQERINGFTRVGVVTDINVAFDTTVQMSGTKRNDGSKVNVKF